MRIFRSGQEKGRKEHKIKSCSILEVLFFNNGTGSYALVNRVKKIGTSRLARIFGRHRWSGFHFHYLRQVVSN